MFWFVFIGIPSMLNVILADRSTMPKNLSSVKGKRGEGRVGPKDFRGMLKTMTAAYKTMYGRLQKYIKNSIDKGGTLC